MSEKNDVVNPYFMQLVLSLQAGVMQQLGKVASPISGKVERDLQQARYTIDIIDMLETKMKGNLTTEEEKFIEHVLYELRLNYVEETKKDEKKTENSEGENKHSYSKETKNVDEDKKNNNSH
ncbi:MAG: DUF1844 domain-containing protein [FCB group bacterium]|nr:DUF1844 domain-containing protein [FCB group bacterium]